MLNLPRWVPMVIGGLVFVFGVYRLRLGFRSKAADEAAKAKGGLYGFGRRTHFLFGIVYILMGIMLGLSAFGVSFTSIFR
jgi:hypothetical protein